MTDDEQRRKRKASDRRWIITVAGTILWIGIGNAGLHMGPANVYGLAVLVAILLWFVTAPRG
jgi:hypothetical protein